MSPAGDSRRKLASGLERAAARESHACLEGCGEVARGLVEAENHLVFRHSYSRPVAQEAIVKAAAAAAPAAMAKCTYCHRTDGTHAPRCARAVAAARDVARKLVLTRTGVVSVNDVVPNAPAREKPMSKSAARKCRLCRKPGHRSNACPTASNGTGGGPFTSHDRAARARDRATAAGREGAA